MKNREKKCRNDNKKPVGDFWIFLGEQFFHQTPLPSSLCVHFSPTTQEGVMEWVKVKA